MFIGLSILLSIREPENMVNWFLDSFDFSLKLTNLNKQHVHVAYMLVFSMQ